MEDLERLRTELLKEAKSKDDILSDLGISGGQFEYMKRQLRDAGFPLAYDRSNGVYYIQGTGRISNEEESMLRAIRKTGVSPSELRDVLEGIQGPDMSSYQPKRIKWSDISLEYGKMSDLHQGHKQYRPDVFRDFVEEVRKKEDVKFVVNAGDTLEGMSRRDGHIYELDYIGFSDQLNFFADEFQLLADIGVIAYSIEADDSHSGWYHTKANMGVDVGQEMDKASKAYKFIGYNEQDLVLEDKLRIRLRHPGGGTAYAISYKMQKYIESLPGGDKPNIVDEGHFHKAEYLFYRGVHCFDVGCMQDQSPFMKRKGTPAHVGFWFSDVAFDDSGIQRITNQFYPYYD